MDRAELFATINDGYGAMEATIAAIPDEQLLQTAMDSWTGKDLVAHMAWWHGHSAHVIESLRSGHAPYDSKAPDNATDAVNARVHDEHQNEAPAVTRKAFSDSFARLRTAIDAASDAELFDADHWAWTEGEALVETILWDTARHYQDHQAHLSALGQS